MKRQSTQDTPEINPNPFDLATLPVAPVSTANVKMLFNCPAGPPNICNLPSTIDAQPVATSIAVGPDGAFFVGELQGFPAPTGASRVWRIEADARAR